jgi:hypothetical protein
VDPRGDTASVARGARVALAPFGELAPPAGDAAAYHAFVSNLDAAITSFYVNEREIFALWQLAQAPHLTANQFVARNMRFVRSTSPMLQNLQRAGLVVGKLRPCLITSSAVQKVIDPIPPTAH